MANEEVLGPRKTMFVLVIVVGCFAVLWPRILSPLMLGQGQLKPNQFDRDAGCCEVIFESEMAVLELVNEVCSSAVGKDGLLSPYAAAECRRTVNETCGLDIAAFLKRTDNVGKSTKVLLNTMKESNSSCLKEHFGVPVWSLGAHTALNSWAIQDDSVKQERSPILGAGPHPALRERGRAIPPGAPTPPSRGPVPMPPHARVRSPLSVYFDVDIKPPPIPGMRPPLGSPGGPVPAPKSSMGFVMPIYTICIIVFFVYTLSKILFKRTGSIPYEHVSPDPQFRRRVFRDDSRTSPDSKLGPKERDAIVTAISGLVAEVHQQMEASYAQSQQRQESQENHTRPYTNGSVHSSPIIIASEYVENKEKTPEPEIEPKESSVEKEASPEPIEKEASREPSLVKEGSLEPEELSPEKEATPEPELKEPTPEKEAELELKDLTPEKEPTPELESEEESLEKDSERIHLEEDLLKLSEDIKEKKDNLAKSTKDFLNEARENAEKTVELLKEALKEDSPVEEEEEVDPDKEVSVKVVGMELTAHTSGRAPAPLSAPVSATAPAAAPAKSHEAEEVKSIFLETHIPQQSRVLVADFEDRAKPHKKHEPTVVSGKMTLSLIQDAPQEEDLPEIDPDSTMDDFTTASAMTQPVAEKEGESSGEEIEEEIEIEEIEEEEEDEQEQKEGEEQKEQK
ncbi:proline-, glutamic acid- and leucine-rich protein 1 isoform X2 [Leguminivora glycinivorella]|uniref:proline-, glutamic acid- and leucine-rich protein 1 isoform X2 n=1 Tax=Leguminivora glycinivorella TaxID=1035111 RepID=UPI00200D540C|nr:proline-, glutamic acid- and leucine-rich protein 1 isoform X2 [Leguminivora glycinivorella]